MSSTSQTIVAWFSKHRVDQNFRRRHKNKKLFRRCEWISVWISTIFPEPSSFLHYLWLKLIVCLLAGDYAGENSIKNGLQSIHISRSYRRWGTPNVGSRCHGTPRFESASDSGETSRRLGCAECADYSNNEIASETERVRKSHDWRNCEEDE